MNSIFYVKNATIKEIITNIEHCSLMTEVDVVIVVIRMQSVKVGFVNYILDWWMLINKKLNRIFWNKKKILLNSFFGVSLFVFLIRYVSMPMINRTNNINNTYNFYSKCSFKPFHKRLIKTYAKYSWSVESLLLISNNIGYWVNMIIINIQCWKCWSW